MGAVPASIYVSADTFPPLNGPTALYSGIFGGLEIDLNELTSEISSYPPSFYGFTDATGDATGDGNGLLQPAGSLPPLGMTIYGTTLIFDPAISTLLGQTRIEALTLT